MAATSADILALAERYEAGSGPDPVLAAHMHCALRGYTIHEDTDPANGIFAFWEGEPRKSLCSNCSSWSDPASSVDLALELIPEGGDWRRLTHQSASVYSRNPYGQEATRYDGQHVEPARAIVAACLRAIAAKMAAKERRGRPSSPPPVFNMEPLPPLSAIADPQAPKGEAEAA